MTLIKYNNKRVEVPEGGLEMVRVKTELPDRFKMSSKIAENMQSLISDMIGNRNKQIEEIFTTYLMVLAKPTIKGEITLGKLRWRGIVPVVESNSQNTWLEQRGKKISPVISGGCMLLHSPNMNFNVD